MEIFDDYILRKIHEASHYKTFVGLIMTSKRFYNNHKDLIPIKRKESLKLKITTYDCDDIIKYYVLPNGNVEGLYEEFYEKDKIRVRCHYIDGKCTGLYEKFRESGIVSKRYCLANNSREGLFEVFYEDGNVRERSYYKNDEKEGLYKAFYESGIAYKRYHYVNGRLDGSYKWFHKDGSVSIRCHYINNKIEGLCEEFYESGIASKRCNYVNGMLEGLYEEFYESGYVRLRCYYIDDKKEGSYEVYREDRTVHLRCHYVNGKKEGSYKEFYSHEILYISCYYVNDNIEGLCEAFYEDGSLKELYDLNNGTLIKCMVNLKFLSETSSKYVKYTSNVYLVDLSKNMCHKFSSITSAAKMLKVSEDVLEKRCKSSKIKHREYWIKESDMVSVTVDCNIEYRNIIEASIHTNISVHDIKILSKTKQSLDGYNFTLH